MAKQFLEIIEACDISDTGFDGVARGMVMDIRAWIGLTVSVVVKYLTWLHLFLADVSVPNFARNCLLPLSQGAPS